MKVNYTLLLFIFCIASLSSQNLLNTSTWTEGTGNVSGFTIYGTTEKNYRDTGLDHLGNEVILWECIPNDTSFQDGGFFSSYIPIDHTKTYRFSVWMKKINSDIGSSYFGCNSLANGQFQTLRLNNSLINSPYFFTGDLPELNKWYLLVGYVHNSSYSSNVSLGKIYDGETGEEVLSLTDFKFTTSAINVRSRSFLVHGSNPVDKQLLYKPTLEKLTSSSPSINQLLSINEESTLIFAYDNAGNQKQRFYCDIPGCPLTTPPAGRPNTTDIKKITDTKENESLTETSVHSIKLYPNPTEGKLTIQSKEVDVKLSHSINIYNTQGALVEQINVNKETHSLELDITKMPTGVYFIHMHFSNGTAVTRKIIKK